MIGTHQVVNRKINFKNLGLLIVDEEQKFGVSIKEKLRAFKPNVDVLALTATPIPRTLQFSLMSARDMSIISTLLQIDFQFKRRLLDLTKIYKGSH